MYRQVHFPTLSVSSLNIGKTVHCGIYLGGRGGGGAYVWSTSFK